MAFVLRSPAFGPGDPVPVKYTADGENISPPLEWTDPPPGTRSFALVVDDPDAPRGTFGHWAVFDIDPEQRGLPEDADENARHLNLRLGINDFGDRGYGGPAPPKGHGVHRYHFRLAALDTKELDPGSDAHVRDVWDEAQDHVIAEAELVATYSR